LSGDHSGACRARQRQAPVRARRFGLGAALIAEHVDEDVGPPDLGNIVLRRGANLTVWRPAGELVLPDVPAGAV